MLCTDQNWAKHPVSVTGSIQIQPFLKFCPTLMDETKFVCENVSSV